jgi:hypothetical protein
MEVLLKAIPQYITKDYKWTSFTAPPVNETDTYLIRYKTDLTLTAIDNGSYILDNYVVKSNIDNITQAYAKLDDGDYAVDLMNPVYGISRKIQAPVTVTVEKLSPGSLFDSNTFNISYQAISGSYNTSAYSPTTPVFLLPPPDYLGTDPSGRNMGGVEYRSDNKYYRTQENFVYQIGGILVNQTDGSSPLNLPEISLNQEYDDMGNRIMAVNITDISIQGSASVSGSSPVQITSILTNVQKTGLDYSKPNAASARIQVYGSADPELWRSILNGIVKTSSISNSSWVNVTKSPDPPALVITGPNSNQDVQDIRLDVNYVDYKVELDAVGKTTGI